LISKGTLTIIATIERLVCLKLWIYFFFAVITKGGITNQKLTFNKRVFMIKMDREKNNRKETK
jgi:hypothetical protein